jgi:hypothetical protein
MGPEVSHAMADRSGGAEPGAGTVRGPDWGWIAYRVGDPGAGCDTARLTMRTNVDRTPEVRAPSSP